MLRTTPGFFWLMAAAVPPAVFLAWTDIRLPALVVEEVTQGRPFSHAALSVGLLMGGVIAAQALIRLLASLKITCSSRYRFHQSVRLDEKAMICPYQQYERKEIRDLHSRAEAAISMVDGKVPMLEVPQQTMDLLQNLLCYLLFGAVISFVSPWLVVLLTAAPMVNWLALRRYDRYEYRTRPQRTDIDRRIAYVTRQASDFTAAKDIRVYGMAHWLRQVYQDLLRQDMDWHKRLNLRLFAARLTDLLVILLRDGIAYAVLIAMALRGEIDVAQFVLYFSAVSGFATYVGSIMTAWSTMQTASLKVCDLREFLDLPDPDTGSEPAIRPDHAPELSFHHVSFRYDGAQRDTLHDLSFTLHPGERVALVGMNGAGKTTLVKLLCGLYTPTGGQITVDGVPVSSLCRTDYYRLFSPVFQDVQTAFFTLAETVAADFAPHIDEARAEACMRQAGLGNKLDTLPLGIHTHLDKQVSSDGIELSGGEAQKLMMARALYKDAPALVLDEPTAALDPIAENEIYLRYRDMTAGKTSLFISHRLASTQFCDRILFLQDGRITEEGTHAQLLAAGGEYARLYEIQSCWYRDDEQGGDLS